MKGSDPSRDNTNMDVALEEAADLCTCLFMAIARHFSQWCFSVKEVTAKIEKIKVRALAQTAFFRLHRVL